MIISGRPPNMDSIKIDSYSFGKVVNFKYLGVNINSKNDIHLEKGHSRKLIMFGKKVLLTIYGPIFNLETQL